MQVYFAADVHSKILDQWYGHVLFDVEDIQPQDWGFCPSPVLTTTAHHMEEGKTLYRIEAQAYRHFQNNNVLLFLSLQRQEGEQEPVEEKVAIIFGRAEDMDVIPQVLHTCRPKHLSDLVVPPQSPSTTGSVTSEFRPQTGTTVVVSPRSTGWVRSTVWSEGSAYDRTWGTTHTHTTTTN